MSANSSSNWTPKIIRTKWSVALGLLLWVFIGFFAAQFLLIGAIDCLKAIGFSFASANQNVLNSILAALIYIFTIAIVIGLPWLVKKYPTTKEEIGLTRLPTWMDIGLAPAGFIVYFLGSMLFLYVCSLIFPWLNLNQAQETGFGGVFHNYELILVFFTLVVLAPFAEETLFRGYLYGKLRQRVPVWVAILFTSALFGVIHGQWNVGLDVFILSVVMCVLREVTGSIWAGMLVHMIKNGIAFYIIFIFPLLSVTMGK